MTQTWLTVDCDDFRHIPKHYGHPTRSKKPILSYDLSPEFKLGMQGFQNWLSTHENPVTLFVIADSLENSEFGAWLNNLITEYRDRITIGCHGLTHKSWSAWPENVEQFGKSITQAIQRISGFAGENFRPWFRAPAGYMAPWMVAPLADCGIIVDSSINDSILTRVKVGNGNTWQQVRAACQRVGLMQREWLTKWRLPVNGPALSIFPLSIIAHHAWRQLPPILAAGDLTKAVEHENSAITTVYWHILDHSRRRGRWRPPIAKSILNH
ncbi:MAG TPA: polysaccharide deacetylase family protein [Candidatus Poseidoniaceae archaeon]|nr:polysaccharide deacetylase family protein [Candidatus Poseidoniaceae archaeon]